MRFRRRRLHLEAVAQLARATLEFRTASPQRAAALLGRVQAGELRATPGQVREAKAIGALVARDAARLPWNPTCLRQALAVQRMLRRRAIPSRLHIGVTSALEGEAHAWVTVGEHVVVGRSGLERFVPLAAFA